MSPHTQIHRRGRPLTSDLCFSVMFPNNFLFSLLCCLLAVAWTRLSPPLAQSWYPPRFLIASWMCCAVVWTFEGMLWFCVSEEIVSSLYVSNTDTFSSETFPLELWTDWKQEKSAWTRCESGDIPTDHLTGASGSSTDSLTSCRNRSCCNGRLICCLSVGTGENYPWVLLLLTNRSIERSLPVNMV